ncbi:MAG: type I DNA topoisomerase [Bacilli bacterium]
MLDRIIGFRLSKLMQSKTGGKSAGRVQSVALKLIVDREREIEAFISEEYWTITAKFADFDAELEKYNNEKIEIHNELEANNIKAKLSNVFTIDSVDKKLKKRKAKPPFITSTLQQEASTKFNFSAHKTMTIAQKLYEGVKLRDEIVGLVTYMRTDSIRLADEFVNNALNFIETNYGKEYVGVAKPRKSKGKIQDAHEAIRPTSLDRTPDSIKSYLTNDEYKLYRMIYFRTLASLMKEAKVNQTIINLENNNYQFKATGQELIFDGYLKVYSDYETNEDKLLPPLDKYHSSVLVSEDIVLEQHFTKPPARYTEAKLIKELEELGIGRPSTYAKIIDTLKDREYVKIIDKKFHPTDIGIITTDKLQEFFKDLINVKYTAQMETDLDNIALGDIVWYELLAAFYQQFEPSVKYAFANMEKKAAEKTGEDCPNCGHPLVIKKGKYGEFIACSNFPTCKYIKTKEKVKEIITDCPKCDGHIIKKQTKKGKIFYGCDNYPKCDYALWDRPTGEKCPECGSLLVENKNNIKCSNCDFKR